MSYIPQDLAEEVLSVLPVRSILRFRCVSRQWRTIIDSPYFIKIHMDRSIKRGSSVEVIHRRTNINFVSLHLDLSGVAIRAAEELDHPFGHRYDHIGELGQPFGHRFNRRPRKYTVNLVGSCNGLLCFVDSANHIVLRNLAAHKYFELPYTEVEYFRQPFDRHCLLKYGFGYDSTNDDYKIIRLIMASKRVEPVGPICEFYSLKSDSWKSVGVSLNLNYYNNFSTMHVNHHSNYGIFVSGVVHWIRERGSRGLVDYIDDESPIVAFDLAKDEVILVPCFDLPGPTCQKILGTVHGCLCLFCYHYAEYRNELWVMKDYGIKESWTKIFIQTSMDYLHIRPIDHSKSKSTMVLEVNKNKLAWYNFEEEEEPITEIDITCTEFSTEACVNHESLVGTSWNRWNA